MNWSFVNIFCNSTWSFQYDIHLPNFENLVLFVSLIQFDQQLFSFATLIFGICNWNSCAIETHGVEIHIQWLHIFMLALVNRHYKFCLSDCLYTFATFCLLMCLDFTSLPYYHNNICRLVRDYLRLLATICYIAFL